MIMKQIIFPIFLIINFFISSNINAQVIKKRADKSQIVNTQKLKSALPKYKLIKIKPNKISKSINSKPTDKLAKKKCKIKKIPKHHKGSNIKYSKVIKCKNDE